MWTVTWHEQRASDDGRGYSLQRDDSLGEVGQVDKNDAYIQDMRDLLHWLHRKWAPDVLVALASGPLRYTSLLATIRSRTVTDRWTDKGQPEIADSTLNRTLRQMELDELVERVRDETVFPPEASYRLTAMARELLDALEPAIEWVGRHPELIDRVQKNRREER